MNREELLERVTKYYLESADFNGFDIRNFNLSNEDIKIPIIELVSDGLIYVNFGDIHPNPHIKAFKDELIEKQVEKIESKDLNGACLYPTEKHLKAIVNPHDYSGKPFTLKLALGEAQLEFYPFDLSVLEIYRNDPRYSYETDDIHGSLSVHGEHYENGMKESDQVFLQTFGFAFNENMDRSVAVYLRYLSDLSPEHQQIWNAKILDGNFFIHPDYHKSTMGHWSDKESIFNAFVQEMHYINKMAELMGRPIFFKQEFLDDKKPRGFSFLIRPTLREYNSFVHLLDKMISENINPNFFLNEVELKEYNDTPDGRIITNKNSLRVLSEWLNQTIQFPDPRPKDEMVGIFKKIRSIRQKPAHAIEEDVFDQKYAKEQRNLVIESFKAVRNLRLIFTNHPNAGKCEIPEWLRKGEIRTF